MRGFSSRSYVIPAICLLVTVYFSYHAVQGARGLRRMEQVTEEIKIASQMAEKTRIEKELLQRKVRALSTQSLDLDQLEESAMRVLNMGNPEDKIIFKDN